MKIRVMTADDAEAYHELRKEALLTQPLAFGADYDSYMKRTMEELRNQLTRKPDGGFTLGAWSQESLIGTVALYRPTEPKFRHGAFLVAMFVTESARGLGCGKKLVQTLLEEAKTISGLEKITLTVSTCQESAVRLYRSVGFETWGNEPRALHHDGIYTDFAHMSYWLR